MTRPVMLALLLATSIVWPQDQVPAPREVFRTSFEQGGAIPDGWTVAYADGGRIQREEGRSKTGRYSVRIVDESEKDAVGLRGPKMAVEPGSKVWLSGWFLSENSDAASIYMEYWDAAGKRMADQVKSFAVQSDGGWSEFRRRSVVPENAANATLLLYCWSGGTCDGYFDDIAFGTGFWPTHDRTPRPPAKVQHPCGPYSNEDIERARQNVARHEWARELLASQKRAAAFWMELPDEEIAEWIPELTPFRVVDCPNCGAQWAYCWTHLNEGRIKCRKCDTVYPNEKFPEAGTETLLTPTGKLMAHPFYEDAKGKKYRLSGRSRYARISRLDSLGALGRCYALTGDAAYASKAVKVMKRLAEVYPDWVPHDWTRIYEDFSNTQSGKMSGWKLHDCTTMLEICLCYDLIYDSGALVEEDKIAIENNVFRELGEMLLPIPQKGCCINDGPYQMSAGAYLGVLLGDHRLIEWAVEPPGGFKGFIREFFFRDGHWEDGSPSYEAMALSKLYLLPEILQGYSDPADYQGPNRYDNLDVLADPLLKKIHIAPLYNMFPDRHLPPINDGAKDASYAARHAEVNYFWYPTERNLALLNWALRGEANETGSEYSLFRRDPDMDFSSAEQLCLSDQSVLRPGLGWAIIRQGEGAARSDLVLDYGEPCGWHGHPDRLNCILWANNREVVTDLGYLGARHPFRPWMAHGVCHNVVMVDGTDQQREPGKLIVFQPGDNVQAVVAEAPETYTQCSKYERAMLLITPAPGVQYVADVFRVDGGKQHDFAFHGDGAQFECPQLEPAKPLEGEVGPKEGGYDWLEDAQSTRVDGEIVADWSFGEQDTQARDTGVRLRILGATGELINAKGPNLRSQSTPYDKPMLDYVIQRRPGPTNTFASVIEPVQGAPVVRQASLQMIAGDPDSPFESVAMTVEHPVGTDLIIVAPSGNSETKVEFGGEQVRLVGRLGVVGLDTEGALRSLWLADGETLTWGSGSLATRPTWTGQITAFDPSEYTVTVDASLPEGLALAGQTLIAQNRMDGAYTIESVTRVGNKSVVKLRGEPVLRVEEGEQFRLPTYGALKREATLSTGLGRLYAVALVAAGCVTADGPGTFAFARGTTGNWQALSPSAAGGTVTVELKPEQFKAGKARLLLTRQPIDLAEVQPPKVESVAPEPLSATGDSFSLGYVSTEAPIVVTVSDGMRLGPPSYSLTGARSGLVPVRMQSREVSELPGKSDYLFSVDDLPGDTYTLWLTLRDQLGNDTRAKIAFQTRGYVNSFDALPVVDSSGKVSKPLPGLNTQFYRAEAPGDYVVYEFEPPHAGEYEISVSFTQADSYGIWQFSVDGEKIGAPVDGYNPVVTAEADSRQLGRVRLDEGKHRIRADVTAKNETSNGYFVGLCTLSLRPVSGG